MFATYYLTLLSTAILSADFVQALPTDVVSSTTSNVDPESVLYVWSDDPQCVSTTCASDCTLAYTKICNQAQLTVSYNATEGECTAFYYPIPEATPPTPDQCTASYKRILTIADQPASGCGGTVGGALGYNSSGERTSNPMYAIYPTNGNANCFKAQGDKSPVLAPNVLPNGGGTLNSSTCPVSTSRRRTLATLEGRDEPVDVTECAVEDGVWGFACNTVCLATVVASSWATGPFAIAGWLACLGGCGATGTKLFNNCEKAKGSDFRLGYNPFNFDDKKRRDEPDESMNPCLNIQEYSFQCPAWQSQFLDLYRCAEPSSGGGSINT